MRDLVAIVVVVILVVFALRMATSLQRHRQGHARLRRAIQERGQTIVAEIPAADGLHFVTEDDTAFHWVDRLIPKDEIRAARVLISGAPISVRVSRRFPNASQEAPRDVDDAFERVERDRWDVAIDLEDETVLVECGAMREQASQELARQVFDAVRRDIEARDAP